MEFGCELENDFVMFDHVKHVEGSTTMAHHVYDSIYYKIMTIAICNMMCGV
jgi:hypothetical protein